MTVRQIKTAINNRIIANGGHVYSSETDEGYDKPAFFVEIVPILRERITAAYEEITLKVEIHYEPKQETELECLRVSEQIDEWFAADIHVGDRVIHAPEALEHTTDDDITLYSSFEITTTRIFNEGAYNGEETPMGDADLDLKIN